MVRAMADLRIFSYLPNPRIWKATIAARLNGVDLEVRGAKPSELASWLRPALSTIALPEFEMGRAAVDILLGAEPVTGVVRIPMPVRDRASVAPPR